MNQPTTREGAEILKNYYGGKFTTHINPNVKEVAEEWDISQESINLFVKEKFNSNNGVSDEPARARL